MRHRARLPVPLAVGVAALAVAVLALAGCGGPPVHRSGPGSPDSHPPPAGRAFEGVASFYHDSLHGNRTANGERYDRNALTAAHRSLAFGTVVVVENLDNGKSVRVRVNDRGPFVKGRVIDVSRRAARELDFVRAGLANVRVEILD